jgi:hypothetical protein
VRALRRARPSGAPSQGPPQDLRGGLGRELTRIGAERLAGRLELGRHAGSNSLERARRLLPRPLEEALHLRLALGQDPAAPLGTARAGLAQASLELFAEPARVEKRRLGALERAERPRLALLENPDERLKQEPVDRVDQEQEDDDVQCAA